MLLYYPTKYLYWINKASQHSTCPNRTMLMLQASTAVQYFSLTWLILLYSQQGERKHVSFANPSTLQKHLAGKNQSIGLLSFRMLLKTAITWLCFCLFSSPNCSRVATERKKRWFSYTARYSGTLLSPLHGGRSTKSPTNDLQILSIFYQAFSEFSLCFSCHKKHRTVKRIVLDSSKACCSPCKQGLASMLLGNIFQIQTPGCYHIYEQDSSVLHTN